LINSQFAEAVNNHNFHLALKLDEQFHQIIIETTDNPYILNTVSTLQSHVRRLYFHKSIILRHESINEHEAILRAFDDNNKELAANIARENWLYPMITTD
jgi:DNA-binding GntR family transcriptional regulator